MLEQKEFRDEQGTVWLNRPGSRAGAPLGTIALLVCAPLLIGLWGTFNAYLLGGLSVVVLALGALCNLVQAALTQATLQTCPKCHYTRQKGYTRCRCGYPER